MSVDVVVPFFNGNEFINYALKSIFDNSFINNVIIVVDLNSCSPIVDDSYFSSGKLKIIYNEYNFGGAGVVRSIGYNAANARFVAFLDCDDVWMSNKLKVQIPHMLKHDFAFSFHGFSHFLDEKNLIKKPIIPIGAFNKLNFYKKKFTIGCLSVVIDKSLIGELPLIKIRRRNDYLLWNFVIDRCEKKSLNWGGIPDVLGFHRITSGSLSSSKFKSIVYYFKFLRACGLSISSSFLYWLYYLYNTVGTR